jgi:hypothetical protein
MYSKYQFCFVFMFVRICCTNFFFYHRFGTLWKFRYQVWRTFFPDGKIIYLYCEIYFICGEPIFKDEPMYNLSSKHKVDKYWVVPLFMVWGFDIHCSLTLRYTVSYLPTIPFLAELLKILTCYSTFRIWHLNVPLSIHCCILCQA